MTRAEPPRLTLFAPVALLIVLGIMTVYLAVNHFIVAKQSREWVLHSYEVIQSAQTTFSHVQDIESGARGFLLTENKDFLDNYKVGFDAFPTDAERLVRLAADNPDQQARAAEIVRLLRTRIKIADERVKMGERGEFAAARAVTPAGKNAMDQARALLNTFTAAEKSLLAERTAESERDEKWGIILSLAVSAVAIVILALLFRNVFLSNRSLQEEAARRETAETEREQASALYSAVFDNVADNLFVIDVSPDGVFTMVDVNPAYERSVGLSIDRLRGRDVRKVIATGDQLVRDYAHIVDTQKPIVIRRQLPFKAGVKTWESTLVPVVDASGRVHRIVGAGRDITERERAEAQARSAQKMEAIGHLTGGVAHDFNNLLQVVRGNLELLSPLVRENEQAAQRLKNALHGADRAAQLTRQLLAFARRQPLEPRVVNLGRLVGDMADLLRRTLGEAFDVETVIPGGLWNTLADPAQVESAVLNLAINARDAMAGGGKLTIEVTNASLEEAYIRQENLEIDAGQYVLLAVSDTGSGMSPSTLARVFEPFFTTKAVDKGTGLGLSMVYGFVKQSNGHVQIDSEEGLGTTVKIYLPRSRKAEDHVAPVPTAPLVGKSEVILVVEDEDMVRSAAVGMLRDLGYACLHAEDAEDALRILKSGAKVDLLFTDVIMPGPVKSRDMAAEAQKMHPGLPVLFTSGYTDNAIVHHGRLDEGVNLLSKPYQKDDLARRIRALLDAAKPVVLIVEDEPLVRMAAVDMVEEAGFVVLQAGDANEALEHLKSRVRIDILFTDVGLPGMRGPELADEARKLRKGLRIVFASGYGEGAVAQEGSGYLAKPYDQEDLERVLRG